MVFILKVGEGSLNYCQNKTYNKGSFPLLNTGLLSTHLMHNVVIVLSKIID